MHFKVLVQSPNRNAWEWTFQGPTFRIGRDPDADLTLDGPDNKTVSWNHLRVDGSGAQIVITDLGSSNGTYLEGTRVQNPVPWAIGQTLSLGRSGPRLELVEVEDPARKAEENDTWGSSQPQSATLSGKVSNRAVETQPNVQAATATPKSGGTNFEQPIPTSQTREMVVELQQRHRRTMIAMIGTMAGVVLLLTAASAYVVMSLPANDASASTTPTEPEAVPQQQPQTPARGLNSEEISDRLLKSTVLIWRRVPDGVVTGTGALVDAENRYVVTNFHVTGDVKYVKVNFPEYADGNDDPIRDKNHYFRSTKTIPGEVVKVLAECDLALIQLRGELPHGVEPLKLAENTPKPGTELHLIGNPGASEGFWAYTSGTVRNVIPNANYWTSYADGTDAFEVNCRIIEAQTPSNAGDSGGPLVNNRVELVGINQSALTDARIMSNAIDVAEVKALLAAVKE